MSFEDNPKDDMPIDRTEYEAWEHAQTEAEECHECMGAGEIIGNNDMEYTCPKCLGSGYEPSEPEQEGD